MSLNIKTSSGLQKLVPDLNKTNIITALGYSPAKSTDLVTHIEDSGIHITSTEKNNFANHINDGNIHITLTEKNNFANHVNNSSIHITSTEKNNFANHIANISNPHQVTAEQIGLGFIAEDNSGNFALADNSGNIAFEVTSTGLTRTAQLEIGGKRLNIIIQEAINSIPEELDPTVEPWAKTDYNGSEFSLVDTNGNIAFSVDERGITHTAELTVVGKAEVGQVIAESLTVANTDVNEFLNQHFHELGEVNGLEDALNTKTTAEQVDTAIDTKLAEFVSAAPAELNSLEELAAALGNDENFAATVNRTLSNKADRTELDALNSSLSESIESETNTFTIADGDGNIAFEVGEDGVTNVAKLLIGGEDIKQAASAPRNITANANDDDVVVLAGTGGQDSVTYVASHANSGVTAGTYTSVTVDAKGHVTAGTNPVNNGVTIVEFEEHTKKYTNPHKVSKEQVGLANVDNTSDTEKPVSTAQREAID